MDCPRCGEDLEARHRGGVEIDVCPRCGGVWLDRGELDKLAYEDEDRVIGVPDDAPLTGQSPPRPGPTVARPDERDTRRADRDDRPHRVRDDDSNRRSEARKRKKRKKESFAERLADALEDIFD